MEDISLKNLILQEKFDFIVKNYYKKLPIELSTLAKLVIINFKRLSNNEEYIILIALYGLVYFNIIDIGHKLIDKQYHKDILALRKSYFEEVNGEKENFLNSVYKMKDELLDLKLLIKYSVLNFENETGKQIIKERENYYKSIGYIIPYLTLKESYLLSFFQDTYFRSLYKEEYNETRKLYIEKINEGGTPGDYTINIIDNLERLLSENDIFTRFKIRRKSYFSIYNKVRRKKNKEFSDALGVRIIFRNIYDLRKFTKTFEEKFIYIKKKDYITNPKENGYQSLHYSFMIPYAFGVKSVELQLRTNAMDKKIKGVKQISHYNYTLKKNKWSDIFSEVTDGYNYMLKYIEDHQNK